MYNEDDATNMPDDCSTTMNGHATAFASFSKYALHHKFSINPRSSFDRWLAEIASCQRLLPTVDSLLPFQQRKWSCPFTFPIQYLLLGTHSVTWLRR